MSESKPDRNLLFGVLALQLDFINRQQLLDALSSWIGDKSQPLDKILLRSGALTDETRKTLQSLVETHLRMHDNDPQKSLAAVHLAETVQLELTDAKDDQLTTLMQSITVGIPLAALLSRDGSDDVTLVSKSSSPQRDRYRILRPHAKGGLGQVSVAHDEEVNREVALKEIRHQYADRPESRERFLREAEVTGRLEHPGIVPVYGLGSDENGRPFYAMRFIRGESLQAAIESFHENENTTDGQRTLELRKLLSRFIDVCNAIEYAHSRGIIHRDLKPDNIMLGKFGETLVVDWGLAKYLDRDDEPTESEESALQPAASQDSTPTRLGSALGTPAFMSPEQASGRVDQLGPASDIYSLGATMYCLLTNKSAFEGTDLNEMLERVRNGEFAPPRQVNSAVPRPLDAICMKAMATKRNRRYGSARELANDIESWLADAPVQAYDERLSEKLLRWTRNHKAAVAGFGALLAAAVVTLTIITLLVTKQKEQTQVLLDEVQSINAKQQQELAIELLKDGVDECQDGRIASGLPRMLQAFDLGVNNESVRESALALLGSWSAALPEMLIHPCPVQSTVLSPDTTTIATSTRDHQVRLWSLNAKREIGESLNCRGPIRQMKFSPNSRTLAVLTFEGELYLIEASIGKPRGEAIQCSIATDTGDRPRDLLAFSNDSQSLFVADRKKWLQRIDVQTQRLEPTQSADSPPGPVAAIQMNPNGSSVLAVCEAGGSKLYSRLWSIDELSPIGEIIESFDALSHENSGVNLFGPLIVFADNHACDESNSSPLEISPQLRQMQRFSSPEFSPDGRMVAILVKNNEAQLRDTMTGEVRGSQLTHDAPIIAVTFSSNAELAATAAEDKQVKIWRTAEGSLVESLPHPESVINLSFNDLSNRLTAISDSSINSNTETNPQFALHQWGRIDGADNKNHVSWSLSNHVYPAMKWSFTADRRTVMAQSEDGIFRFFDLEKGGLRNESFDPQILEHGFQLSNDGNIATSKSGFEVNFRELPRDENSIQTIPDNDPVLQLCFGGGDELHAKCASGAVLAWNSNDGTSTNGNFAPWQIDDNVVSTRFSRDRKFLVTYVASDEPGKAAARLWNVASRKSVGKEIPVMADEDVVVSPDGSRIACLGTKDVLFGDAPPSLWNVETGEKYSSDISTLEPLTDAGFTSDGQYLYTVEKSKLQLWSAADGNSRPASQLVDKSVELVARSASGCKLAIATSDGSVHIWNLADNQFNTLPRLHGGRFDFLAFRPDAQILVSSQLIPDSIRRLKEVIRFWDLTVYQQVGEVLLDDDWNDVMPADQRDSPTIVFSPNGKSVAFVDLQNRAQILDVFSTLPLTLPMQHMIERGNGGVLTLAFNPDGKTLVTGGADGTIRFWPVPKPAADNRQHLGLWVESHCGIDVKDGKINRRLTAKERRTSLDKLYETSRKQ